MQYNNDSIIKIQNVLSMLLQIVLSMLLHNTNYWYIIHNLINITVDVINTIDNNLWVTQYFG